jgi:hypothetical protein
MPKQVSRYQREETISAVRHGELYLFMRRVDEAIQISLGLVEL